MAHNTSRNSQSVAEADNLSTMATKEAPMLIQRGSPPSPERLAQRARLYAKHAAPFVRQWRRAFIIDDAPPESEGG